MRHNHLHTKLAITGLQLDFYMPPMLCVLFLCKSREIFSLTSTPSDSLRSFSFTFRAAKRYILSYFLLLEMSDLGSNVFGSQQTSY